MPTTIAEQIKQRSLIAGRIKQKRKTNGLTREQLAVAAGVSAATVGRIERGERGALDTLIALAGALNTTLLDLLAPE